MMSATRIHKPPRWFDRSFRFQDDPLLYPLVLARLRGSPVRFEEILMAAPETRLRERPGGKWCPLEHLGHLYELEALGERRIDDYLAGAAVLSAADLSNAATDAGRYHERELTDLLGRFRARRRALVTRLESLAPEAFSLTALHPRLNQPFRLVDLATFIAEHDDHHLADLHAILSAAG